MARSDPWERTEHSVHTATRQTYRNLGRHPATRRTRSALPADAAAVIEARSRPVNQGGGARSGEWVLRFTPRPGPMTGSLTGGAGSNDPLAQISICFPSREAAVRFADRHALAYEVRDPPPPAKTVAGKLPVEEPPATRLCCWPTGPHPLCCGNYPVLAERKGGGA